LIQALAESILTKGQEAPILVREDGTRFVWLRACIGWKPVGHWVRQLCRLSRSDPASLSGLRIDEDERQYSQKSRQSIAPPS
jgi:hypothetical protein